ncbi:hypothetical protein [Cyanobium sp. NIES-981]|uniref:hypothetical protein n=1 Tax=Cyanobium sp. NIES-981 TaxID=1851505 RepID=UPI0007DDCABC|nr:hypothetical protein [Cyanobium sp. NIES-981]SBO42670.1 protein of unknown function [Cyanobium sp. NIES-981]
MRPVSLRSLGRLLYQFITSSGKRPFLKASLEDLEALIDESSSASETFRLLGIFDELTYRITSPERRDRLKTRIADQLLRIERIRLPISSDRKKISELRANLLSTYAEKAEAERKAKEESAAEQSSLEAEAKAQRAAREAAAEKARLEAEAKAQREEAERKEAERKAREAAAEKARLEAEAKAQREEAERKEAERKAREAAAEKARLEAEAKAQREEAERKEAERKAREAAAEKARLEAEAKAQREEAERKEAERKAREAAAEKARLEAEAKAQREEAERKEAERKAREAAAEKARLEAEAKAQREEAERKEAERKAREAAAEKARLEAEVWVMPDLDLTASRQLEERAEADARPDAASGSFSQTPPSKGITRRMSREEEKEERRELARLRRLEREGEAVEQSEDELTEADLDGEFEPAEPFAPYLRGIPEHWSDWSEQHWNIKLLDYCFVQKANENSSQGIPSTEEDLAFVTGDREADPAAIAQALVDRVREFSFNRGLSPARLLIKRLETWDYKQPGPPRYFAFLWTTCLIAQGFPSPFEKGEFHRRYERDDVYGANETQFLSRNLPAAWVRLSKWLDRDDIFDAHAHRRLVLPRTDPRRSIISHSWKLSFPCRSDRKRLHDILGRVDKAQTSQKSVDLQLISSINYQGGFTPEFTAALKQQIDLLQKGSQPEEWLSAIIRREIEAGGSSQVQSEQKRQTKGLRDIPPRVVLHLDDEDCYLEMVVPSQSVAIEKARRLSHKTYCAITLETKEKTPRVIGELDIDGKQEDLIIPELRVKIAEEGEEYVLTLRHEGLDNAVLAEWRCEGLINSKPYILFDSETNEIIKDGALIGCSLSLLVRRSWDVDLSDGIVEETEEPIRVSKLGEWRLFLLAKTGPPEKPGTISLANAQGEKCDICWVNTGAGKPNSKPVLKGLSLPGQANRFVMLAENPELWLPPAVTDAQIEIVKIEDDEFYMPIGFIQVPSTEGWQQAGARKLIASPGLYSVRVSYLENTSTKTRKWSRNIMIAEQPDIRILKPASLQAKYRFKDILKVLDIERDVSPLVFQESHDFWNADWLIIGLWPHEKIRVRLAGDEENYSRVLSANSSGSCEIPISAFEPYLLSRESVIFSIQRQGFICQYQLGVLNGPTIRVDQQLTQATAPSTATSTKAPAKKRRSVDMLEIVVYGMRSEKVQDMLAVEIEALMEDSFGHLERRTVEYPDTKRAPGRRFVFHRISLPSLDNEDKDKLRAGMDSLVGSTAKKSGLDFRAEWKRGRE